MIGLLRKLSLVAIAGGLSWWVLLSPPQTTSDQPAPPDAGPPRPIAVTPRFETTPADPQDESASSDAVPEPAQASHPPSPAPTPPDKPIAARPESGTPDASEPDASAPDASAPDASAPDASEPDANEPDASEPDASANDSARPNTEPKTAADREVAEDDDGSLPSTPLDSADDDVKIEQLMRDPELIETARAELSGTERKGFTTVLLTSPEDQVAIARFFGEQLVMIPRSALNERRANPVWFRLRESNDVETVRGRPALEHYRQYRDLFDYEYQRLPEPLRTLRRSVLSRSGVYLFAALIPPTEWAAIIGRRQQALTRAKRDASQVRRFVLRYVSRPGGGYDFRVEDVVFADGSHFRPPDTDGD